MEESTLFAEIYKIFLSIKQSRLGGMGFPGYLYSADFEKTKFDKLFSEFENYLSKRSTAIPRKNEKQPKVYLSGGMHGDWQDYFINAYTEVLFVDPRKSGLTNPIQYSKWDRINLLDSDLVIAYMSEDNPSGIGLIFEVGVAIGAGIPVLMINEKEDRYFDIIHHNVTLMFPSTNDMADFFIIMGGLNMNTIQSLCRRNENKFVTPLLNFYKNGMREIEEKL